MSTFLGWSPADQLAAVTSVQDEREACSGCGLRPDQHTLVEADIERCPGCEARARAAKKAGEDTAGIRTAFYPVTDTRASIWAQYTQRGREWLARHRRDPDPILFTEPPEPDK